MDDVTRNATPEKMNSAKDHDYRRWTDGALPNRQDLGSHINDSIFCSSALANPLPKYRFPASENRPRDIFRVVSDELFLDGNARQNLATFCQTYLNDDIHELMDLVDRQEHDRQGRVSSHGRDWKAAASTFLPICGIPRKPPPRPAARPPGRAKPACWAAWRSMAQSAHESAGQTDRQAQSRHRPGAGLLAQIRALFRRSEARNSAGARPHRHDADEGSSAWTRIPSASCRPSA